MGFTTTLLLTIPNPFPKCSEISHREKPLESSGTYIWSYLYRLMWQNVLDICFGY